MGATKFDPANFRARFLALIDSAAYGKQLAADLLCDPDILRTLEDATDLTNSPSSSMRVRLFIHDSASDLHSLHWEKLWDPIRDSWLLTNEHQVFSRLLSRTRALPPVRDLSNDPRALVVIANPIGLKGQMAISNEWRQEPLDVSTELALARDSLGSIFKPENCMVSDPNNPGKVTLQRLLDRLRDGFEVLYLVCHGSIFGPNHETHLLLEDDDGSPRWVSGSDLVTRVEDLKLEHEDGMAQQPLVIVLASCQSAGAGDGVALAALGPRLAQSVAPAVVAMQDNIRVTTMREFMTEFFRQLRAHGVVDQAMAAARARVRDCSDAWVPVLFMSLLNGQVWNVKREAKASATVGLSPPLIYVSHYAVEGEAIASLQDVFRQLQQAGFSVASDEYRLQKPGWRPELFSSMGRAKGAVILISPAALESEVVGWEASILAARRDEPAFRLLRVMSSVTDKDLMRSPLETFRLSEIPSIVGDNAAGVGANVVAAFPPPEKMQYRAPLESLEEMIAESLAMVPRRDLVTAAGYLNPDIDTSLADDPLRQAFAHAWWQVDVRHALDAIREFQNVGRLPKTSRKTLFNVMVASWVNPYSARWIPEVALGKLKRSAAANAVDVEVGVMYVLRACYLRPANLKEDEEWPVVEVNPRRANELAMKRLIEDVRIRLKLALCGRLNAPDVNLHSALKKAEYLKRPIIVLLLCAGLESNMLSELWKTGLTELQTAFETVTFFCLLSDDQIAPDQIESAGVRLLLPPIDPQRASDAVLGYQGSRERLQIAARSTSR
ncbi:MAG TPA: CHAT domain-containing protein [Chloroflexia bacterium]|nr:CHAT domain-containing protein [Chloroflexia bacterium]